MSAERYQKYPVYVDSGVLELGRVPEHWVTSKIAFTFSDNNAGEVIDKSFWGNGNEVLYTCNKTPLESDFTDFPARKRTTSKDLLLTRNGTPYVHLPCENAIYSNVVQRITLNKDFDRFFLKYCLGNSALFLRGYGVSIESFNFEMWKSLAFSHPDKKEQLQIVEFLDHETAKIDTLIDKQQQLIKLLKEKRQAVISHAVTKGLNPAAPMKDSGVEWLGEVPEHWSAVRIKQVASFITSGPRGWSDFISEEGEDIFLQSGDLNHELEILPHKAKKVIAPKGAEGVRTKLIEGDVVVCITGANTGRVAVVQNLTATTYINQHLSLIRPFEDKVDATFIGYALSSQGGRAYFDVTQYGLKEGLSLSNVAEAPLPLPPLNEQKNIVQNLHARLSVFSRINGFAENQVKLLQERRTALISAAVTGKIDVRNWQPAQSELGRY